jgi:hypothetical protein
MTRAIVQRRGIPSPTLPIVLVEDAGVGTGLIAELRRAGISAIGVPAEHDKEVRGF